MTAFLDLDGTLCDPREGILKGFVHAFQELGLPCPPDASMAALIGQPLQSCFEALGAGASSAMAARHFQAFFESRGFAESHLYTGAQGMLQALKMDGWRRVLVTAKPAFAARFVVRALGIEGDLDAIFGCAAEELSPPKGPILAEALRAHPGLPAFLLGDRDQDRDAARLHAIPFLAAGWGFGSEKEHLGAWAVARQPQDVCEIVRKRFGLGPNY